MKNPDEENSLQCWLHAGPHAHQLPPTKRFIVLRHWQLNQHRVHLCSSAASPEMARVQPRALHQLHLSLVQLPTRLVTSVLPWRLPAQQWPPSLYEEGFGLWGIGEMVMKGLSREPFRGGACSGVFRRVRGILLRYHFSRCIGTWHQKGYLIVCTNFSIRCGLLSC